MKPVLSSVLALTLLGNLTSARATTDDLSITFLAVGQGDAALYRGPCGQVGLIDANRGSVSRILGALDAAGSRHLAWISPSHYDADHLGDVVDVGTSPGVSVQTVYDRGGDRNAKDTATYRSYFDWVTSGSTVRAPSDIGARFSLCTGDQQVQFTVLSAGTDGSAAGGLPVSEENDRGLCLLVEYRDFDLATCGDINGTNEGSRSDVETAVAPAFGDVEFAHINHHGSRYSSNSTYVSRLSAQATVVSVGNNAFGHPNPEVLTRWRTVGEVYQTQASDGSFLDGDVTLTTDGLSGFSVNTTASSKLRSYPLDGSSGPSGSCVQSTSLLIGISRKAVVYGNGATVHGRLLSQKPDQDLAGQSILLERRDHGKKDFVRVASLLANAVGKVAFAAKPIRSAEFRFRFEGAACLVASSSPNRSVGVRPRISAELSPSQVSFGSAAKIKAVIRPAHPGQRMRLQRFANGRWRTVQAKTMSGQLVQFTIRPLSQGILKYRARKSADKDHLLATSRVLQVAVI